MPHLCWQCSDRAESLPGIRAWLHDAGLPNTPEPILLDAARGPWPLQSFDAIFSANTLHIMSWPEVLAMFAALPTVCVDHAILTIYGPFKYGGRHTSDSNAAFERSLRIDDPSRGIRDFEAVDSIAVAAGFRLVEDNAMPANNRLLIWQCGARR